MTSIAEYASSRELFNNLTLRELRTKYKRSVLGWAWSLLNPLSTMLIFTVVFRFFLKVQAPTGSPSGMQIFALYLLCGLLPFNFLQTGVNGSIGSLVGNANLIKKTYFPRELLVGSNVAASLVSHLIEMSLLLVALMLFGNVKALLYVPVALVIIVFFTMFVTGLGLMFSVFNVYFRDVEHLIGIVFQIWFYMTPIVYPLNLVPENADILGFTVPVRHLLYLNPLTDFTEAFRNLLYDLRLPPVKIVAYAVVVSVAVFFAGLSIFNRLKANLAEEL